MTPASLRVLPSVPQTAQEQRLIHTIELAAHCGRLAGVARAFLEADESNLPMVKALAEAALESFDNWQNESTGGTVTALADRDGAAREEQLT